MTSAGGPTGAAGPWARLDAATADVDPPLAAVDLSAFDANADDLVRRAGGRPIRVASKSVRCRALLQRVLARPGFAGVLAYSLAEALWLVGSGLSDDVVVAYPTVDRGALAALAADEAAARAIALMVDDVAQLDVVDAVVPAGRRPALRLCLDVDASLRLAGGRLHVGVRRSPVHDAASAARLARAVVARPGFRLVGLMLYEAQIAGVGDRPPGRPALGAAVRAMQRLSVRQLADRRPAVRVAVEALVPLELVNGGGTGSLEVTGADPAVTELTAGSGLYGPALFDGYRRFRPMPAVGFALPVVRRPAPGVITCAAGGWVASGPAGADRLPVPVHPAGLRLLGTEGAGEVQTPVTGVAARQLAVGDRVWFRHAKAGELCERVAELHLVDGDASAVVVPTYRGDGRSFG